tara:strand:+ start:209 stop:985 length:777 start_codon:yes stop_codon:yes gene_type:complete
MRMLKRLISKGINAFGYDLKKIQLDELYNIAVELDSDEVEIIRFVLENNYTMTSVPRLVNTLKSCKYVVENQIPGDFVECGVWRGGNGILAKKIFDKLGSDKKIWMFDTFNGMTAPSEFDVKNSTKVHAKIKYQETLTKTHSEWCYASIDDVKNNFKDSSINLELIKFIKGDVSKTLLERDNLPNKIAVLRLDTDWYASTKTELEVLYPLLQTAGVLIIDDYGHWEGARKAVDEYFKVQKNKPLFNVIDYTGRSALKL